MVKTLILAAGLAALAGTAGAQSWTTVQTQGGQALSFDPASVVRDGSSVSFTARMTQTPPRNFTLGTGQVLPNVAWMTEMYTVDCEARTYVDRGVAYYDAAGAVLFSESTPGPSKPIGTVQQSLVGGLVSIVCPG